MDRKKRLDQRVQQLLPAMSRASIAQSIKAGWVTVNGHPLTKPGSFVKDDAIIEVHVPELRFVSRAGFKLERALEHFGIDVSGMTCLDAGLSTGGFTDCLLQRGAAQIFGVDVGTDQVHATIRADDRVVVMERTNLRDLNHLPGEQLVDCVTLDLSFISVLKVIPAVRRLMKPSALVIVLIKPQFETTRAQIGRGGIIKDPVLHKQIVAQVMNGICAQGFACQGIIESPLKGSSGNTEFLGCFTLLQS